MAIHKLEELDALLTTSFTSAVMANVTVLMGLLLSSPALSSDGETLITSNLVEAEE